MGLLWAGVDCRLKGVQAILATKKPDDRAEFVRYHKCWE
jgi:hypothetical protein